MSEIGKIRRPTKIKVDDLRCTACGAELQPLVEDSNELACGACSKRYAIIDGVPHFAQALESQERTANSFGFAWGAFWKGLFGNESVFGLKLGETEEYFFRSMGITRQDLDGAKILDAGTGSGRLPMSLQKFDCHVYCVDIHAKLTSVAKEIQSESVSFYQADLLKLPFEDGFFDIVWTSGVIHHTPDSGEAFAALAKKLKPGGRMFVSVYGETLHHYRLCRRLIPFSRHLPPAVNYGLAIFLAMPMYAILNCVVVWFKMFHRGKSPPYRAFGIDFGSAEYKAYLSIVLNIFDQLHPKYQREHSVMEVREWFAQNEFDDIVTTEATGMVEMRGAKRPSDSGAYSESSRLSWK